MNQKDNNAAIIEMTPLVFQLREFVKTEPGQTVYLDSTQSSCGGEDV